MTNKTVIAETRDHRLSIVISKCLMPKDLTVVQFVREQLGTNKQVESTSTCEFYLYPEEIMNLSRACYRYEENLL